MGEIITFITLTYNQLERATRPFIDSLYKYTSPEKFRLIVIDNASSDGTVEYLKALEQEKDNITVIYNAENVGYSKGNNQGMRIAETEYIGLLNNDVLFSPQWLERTLAIFDAEQNVGFVSPADINRPEVKVPLEVKLRKAVLEENYIDIAKEESQFPPSWSKALYITFSTTLFKKSFIDDIGLLDEFYTPAFYEDLDLCFRSVMNGYINYYVDNAFVFHNHSTSTKNEDFRAIAQRNEEYYFGKHFLAEYTWKLHIENGKYKIAEQKRKLPQWWCRYLWYGFLGKVLPSSSMRRAMRRQQAAL